MRTPLLSAALALTLTMFMYVPAQANWRRDEIRYQGLTQVKWSKREVIRTIRAAVWHWPVPGGADTALAIASCESGLRYNASNGGQYLGVWQQSADYWFGRLNTYDSRRWDLAPSPFNARSSTIVSIRIAHNNGWGAWSCA